MVKKINNKGFTLIELLATIVILSLLSVVVGGSVLNYYETSKEKAEEAFISSLERQVEDYISRYGSALSYINEVETKEKCYTVSIINGGTNEKCTNVSLSKTTADIEVIEEKISNKPFVNPSTEKKCTNADLTIDIYRDTDYVYCFTMEENNEGSCLNGKEINTCRGIYKDWNPEGESEE